jgi:tetratricopeptide (TPR) repeat protein
MRVLSAFSGFLFLTFIGAASAAESQPNLANPSVLPPPKGEGRQILTSLVPVDPHAEIERLLDSLAKASDTAESNSLEQQIRALWQSQGGATEGLYLFWSLAAVSQQDYPRALDLLDQAIALNPGSAEAYFRRSTVHYLLGDTSQAFGDLQVALKIEPRHFAAMWALAAMLLDLEQHERALEVLRRLQGIDPHFAGLDAAIEGVVNGSHGRDI